MSRIKRTLSLRSVVTLPLVALTLVGFAAAGHAGAATKSATITVAKTDLGKVLVSSRGRTVYLFQKDTGTQSQCTDACAANWPPLPAKGTPKAGSGAKTSLLGTTTRPDGTMQVTYNGHPVYMFQGDRKAGNTNGQGIDAFGAHWYVLNASGNAVTKAPSSSSSSSGSGSSGY
jgi:predicted lipoprotein with Yx(FWY)xxD motif